MIDDKIENCLLCFREPEDNDNQKLYIIPLTSVTAMVVDSEYVIIHFNNAKSLKVKKERFSHAINPVGELGMLVCPEQYKVNEDFDYI